MQLNTVIVYYVILLVLLLSFYFVYSSFFKKQRKTIDQRKQKIIAHKNDELEVFVKEIEVEKIKAKDELKKSHEEIKTNEIIINSLKKEISDEKKRLHFLQSENATITSEDQTGLFEWFLKIDRSFIQKIEHENVTLISKAIVNACEANKNSTSTAAQKILNCFKDKKEQQEFIIATKEVINSFNSSNKKRILLVTTDQQKAIVFDIFTQVFTPKLGKIYLLMYKNSNYDLERVIFWCEEIVQEWNKINNIVTVTIENAKPISEAELRRIANQSKISIGKINVIENRNLFAGFKVTVNGKFEVNKTLENFLNRIE